MSRQIRVKVSPKDRPEIRLYVLALLALARQLEEQRHPATSPDDTEASGHE